MSDEAFTTLVLSRDGAVATIRLNRPKALNALDPTTLRELARAVREIRRDAAVRAVVITGEGDRAFCAGADVAAMAEMTPAEGYEYCRRGHEVLGRVEALDVPVIAAVNGVALGGGLELALVCDLIVAADSAKLGLPETNLGLIPGFGGTQRLVLRTGLARARELIYLGSVLPAPEAAAIGIVNRLVAKAELAETAATLAAQLAGRAPVALRQAKRATRAAAEAALSTGLALEIESFALTFASADRVEGLKAFLAKRTPEWTGK